jgi:TIR domain
MNAQATPDVARVYLAHGSEDHETLAKPLAQTLMAHGIDVWFDEWEIRAGDSLRRKMEEGLANCTHFVVLLTPNSLHKPWVETEIDAGFIRAVGGESRFIGIRAGVSVNELSPFLRTLRCPEVRLDQQAEVEALIADVHGVSRKPERGAAPRYVKTLPEGLKGWSASAVAVAEYLVRSSECGGEMDPQTTVAAVCSATGLPAEDVEIGVLDLSEAGLVKCLRGMMSLECFWPETGLFVEFDQPFLGFDNRRDAIAVANWLVSQKIDGINIAELAPQFADWPARRLNSALNYLDDAKLIHPIKAVDSSPWTMHCLHVTDRTRRFARDHGPHVDRGGRAVARPARPLPGPRSTGAARRTASAAGALALAARAAVPGSQGRAFAARRAHRRAPVRRAAEGVPPPAVGPVGAQPLNRKRFVLKSIAVLFLN